jgi:hypothetical protein
VNNGERIFLTERIKKKSWKIELLSIFEVISVLLLLMALFPAYLLVKDLCTFGFQEGVRVTYERAAYPNPFHRPPIPDERSQALQFELEETHRAYQLFMCTIKYLS